MRRRLANPLHANDAVVLAVALLGICTTGPIIADSSVPPLALAAWRCLLGALVLAAAASVRHWSQWRQLTGAQWRGMVAAGLFLALHFATWVPSIKLTTVASSTALVATQPVWAALFARARGQEISRSMWAGIAISLSGAVWLAGADFAVASPRALLGDALALLGAILAAAYVTAGEHVRASVGTNVYSAVVYGIAAVLLLGIAASAGTSLGGWDSGQWTSIITLTVFGQLIGHTLINRVLLTTSATVTSTAILFEMPGSTLIAAVWLKQSPPAQVWPALGLVLVGLYVVVRAQATLAPRR
ncbi:MAG: DMT family transporter [Actinobacteria bacterium]|nr:DMT family transporter [Actinomycetota bacterium]